VSLQQRAAWDQVARLAQWVALEQAPSSVRSSRLGWLAQEPRIKGLGYKEASHFLRNIGFKGYGILDKHVVRCLAEMGVIKSAKPPTSRKTYLETETRMREFADQVGIDFDELDLVLWSMKTGEVLK